MDIRGPIVVACTMINACKINAQCTQIQTLHTVDDTAYY